MNSTRVGMLSHHKLWPRVPQQVYKNAFQAQVARRPLRQVWPEVVTENHTHLLFIESQILSLHNKQYRWNLPYLALLRSIACVWRRGSGALWAKATKNVKKPQSQTFESCRKAWFKIFVKQNRFIFCFNHTFDSEVCYCTKWIWTKKRKLDKLYKWQSHQFCGFFKFLGGLAYYAAHTGLRSPKRFTNLPKIIT